LTFKLGLPFNFEIANWKALKGLKHLTQLNVINTDASIYPQPIYAFVDASNLDEAIRLQREHNPPGVGMAFARLYIYV